MLKTAKLVDLESLQDINLFGLYIYIYIYIVLSMLFIYLDYVCVNFQQKLSLNTGNDVLTCTAIRKVIATNNCSNYYLSSAG